MTRMTTAEVLDSAYCIYHSIQKYVVFFLENPYFGSLDTFDANFVLLMHRPEQTCQLLRQGHHQQEFPCHPQQLEAHHSQEQIQEGPAYGELNLWFWGG